MPQQARVACATGERPPIQPCIIQWSEKHWPMPYNTPWKTREETTYFTADCALIHGYRLHPWIASCPGNGPGIRPMMPRGQWVQRQAMRMANRRSHSDLSPGCSRPPQQVPGI